MKISTLFLPNTPDYFSKANMTAAAKFDRVFLQPEMFATTHADDTPLLAFAPTMTPADWLREQGVEVWAHLDAWLPADLDWWKGDRQPAHDPWHFRGKLWRLCEDEDLWLYGHDGAGHSPVLGKTGKKRPDPTKQAYRNALVSSITEAGFDHVLFDSAYLHAWGYSLPWLADHKDTALYEAQFEVYDELRRAGVKVWANSAWEMDNPADSKWHYPAIEHLDGVCCELFVGHYTGFKRWDNNHWWTLTEKRYQRMAADWREAGKDVMQVTRWKTNAGSYDKQSRYYVKTAELLGADFAPHNQNYSTPAASWLPWFESYQDKPAPPEDLAERVTSLELDVRRLAALAIQQGAEIQALAGQLDSLRHHLQETP